MPGPIDPIDPIDLLDFIEGDLPPGEAARLDEQLLGRPDVARAVEQMRQQRTTLRALPETDLPRDFVAALEPMLARPLLVKSAEFRPGVLRRQRSRDRRQRAIRSLARAAVLLIIVTSASAVGALAVRSEAVRAFATRITGAPVLEEIAAPERQPAPRVVIAPPVALDAGPVHHHWRQIAVQSPPTAAPPSVLSLADPQPVPFAMVVESMPAAELESMLTAELTSGSRPMALVRNLSYDEAADIEREFLAQYDASKPLPAPIASVDPPTSRDAIRELGQRVSVQIPRGSSNSGVITGLPRLMPPYEQQLAYAVRGAQLTVAVEVSQLSDIIARTNQLIGGTRLELMERDEATSPLADRPAIIAALAELEAGDPAQVIWLPVIVAE